MDIEKAIDCLKADMVFIILKMLKKHKRIRRKCNYDKKIEINPTWSMYV